MQPWEKSSKTVFRVCICFGHLLELEDAFESDKYQLEEQQDYTLQNSPVEENLYSTFQKE